MFQLRDEHVAALRRHAFTTALGNSFREAGLEPETEAESGDLLARDAGGRQTRISFDEQGFIGGVTSPLGRTWRMRSDREGRLEESISPSGLRLRLDRDEQGRVRSMVRGGREVCNLDYDRRGALAKIAYPDQTARTIAYDEQGRIAALGDRRGATEVFDHDSRGLLKAIGDGNGHQVRFVYMGWNRPSQAVYPDGSRESYHYNPEGRVDRIEAGAEPVVDIAYDGEGRPVTMAFGDGETVALVYDDAGRVVQASCGETEVRYTYDAQGKVVREEQGTDVVQYLYDTQGIFVGMTYPTGERVSFTYDDDFRPAVVTDWNGGLHRFTYGRDDRSTARESPGAVRTVTRLTEAGLPQEIVVSRGAGRGGELFSLRIGRDAEDRVRETDDSEFGQRLYSYDAEGQLLAVRADPVESSETFAYDAAGNRTASNGQGAAFNALNQLVRQGATQCRYDARGNLVSQTMAEGEWSYAWSRRNLLVRAQGPGGLEVTFGYDAFARRIWKRSGETTVRYIWAGEHLLREITRVGPRTSVQDYLYLPGTGTPLVTRLDGRVFAFHTDHLGTPRRITDDTGQVVWSADYAAFGAAQVKVGRIGNHLRFPGQYHDSETGLHYNRSRYYSPALGRYLSRDPVGFLGGLNLYLYAGNDSINESDPLGLSWWGVGLAIVASIVVVVTAPLWLPAVGIVVVDGLAATIVTDVAAGAVGFGLNQALNEQNFCLTCILKAAAIGAIVQPLAAALLGAVAGGLIRFLPKAVATAPAASTAAETTASSMVDANRALALDFYTNQAGFSEAKALQHMEGIDFTQPVTVEHLDLNTSLQQYVRPDGDLGNYFAPVGTPPLQSGLTVTNQTLGVFQNSTEGVVSLKSIAAPDYLYPPGAVLPGSGAGGGVQYFIPNSSAFTPVPP
ncbi:MAG TPA: RHS repeat-associated core domain-containing protein [Thermoanaerobaculia bacterium]|nr:RHS repeat-associated core domain-containing protein [Thermoanaerobaculia bacterium]